MEVTQSAYWDNVAADTALKETVATTIAAAAAGGDEPSPDESAALDGTASRTVRRTRTLTRAVSKYKVSFGVHSIQNLRHEMEDAHCALLGLGGASERTLMMTPLPPRDAGEDAVSCTGSTAVGDFRSRACSSVGEAPTMGSLSYFAVFDGHGGARASEFSGERLGELIAEDVAALAKDPVEALRQGFLRTEAEWHVKAMDEELMDGTTAAVVLVDRTSDRVIVGNVGDSEVILGTKTKDGQTACATLTEVHHLKRSESEAARIAALGGRIWRGRLGHPKINPLVCSLSVSRSIGDVFFKDPQYTDGKASGLIAEPFITSAEVCGRDVAEQFLIVGCDGLWDTVTYKEAVDFVFKRFEAGEDPQAISEGLVHLASEAGSSDNITVLVVSLTI